jgi:virulence-associated protein VagC
MTKHRLRHRPAEEVVTVERRVRLFRNGRNQAIRIPRDMELPGKEAILYREGERLVIAPAPPDSLLAVLATPLGHVLVTDTSANFAW